MAYYTGRGDDGATGLLGSGRFAKSDAIFAAIGDVDELNSAIGVALYYTHDNGVRAGLREIQNDLFIIGANIASKKVKIRKAVLNRRALARLEASIEEMGRQLPALNRFVLPGGCEAAAHLHTARSIARRTERSIVEAGKEQKTDRNVLAYMNRLSSYLFVAAIYLNYIEGIRESHPAY